MGLENYRTKPAVWGIAGLVTLLVHTGVIVAVLLLGLFDSAPVSAPAADVIQVVFAPPEPPAASFTELPPNLADDPPDDPDFLSNIDSRARDAASSGETSDLPAMDGIAETPQVRMESGPPTELPAPHPDGRESLPTPPDEQPSPAGDPVTDLPQVAMENPEGNVPISGDISLNTTAWEYAPWMAAFRRAIVKRWTAPVGFHLGLIHGWTLVELVVDPTGTLLACRTIREEGHHALRDASLHACRVAAPFQPLPEGFPEETLIIHLRMSYPESRSRTHP